MSTVKAMNKFILSILALCASVGAANATTVTGYTLLPNRHKPARSVDYSDYHEYNV